MPPVSTFATPWSMNSCSRSSVAGAPATPRTPRCIMSCSRVVSRVVPYFATPTAFFFWRCTGTRSPAVAPFPAARCRSSSADTPGASGCGVGTAPGGRRGGRTGRSARATACPASSCDSAPAAEVSDDERTDTVGFPKGQVAAMHTACGPCTRRTVCTPGAGCARARGVCMAATDRRTTPAPIFRAARPVPGRRSARPSAAPPPRRRPARRAPTTRRTPGRTGTARPAARRRRPCPGPAG